MTGIVVDPQKLAKLQAAAAESAAAAENQTVIRHFLTFDGMSAAVVPDGTLAYCKETRGMHIFKPIGDGLTGWYRLADSSGE